MGIPHAASASHVSFAAMRALSKKVVCWGGTNSVLRYEPTWGDVDSLVKILTWLTPNNSPQLLAAISAGSPSAKAIQRIRNGSAHNNRETQAEISLMQPSYVVFPITHPTQAMFWIVPSSQDYLIVHSINELLHAAGAAVA